MCVFVCECVNAHVCVCVHECMYLCVWCVRVHMCICACAHVYIVCVCVCVCVRLSVCLCVYRDMVWEMNLKECYIENERQTPVGCALILCCVVPRLVQDWSSMP